jgi:Secretion system C-terminal sorting domain
MLQHIRSWVIIAALLLQYAAGHSQPNIVRVEYYLDIDPGKGLATSIPIVPSQELNNISVSVPVGALSQGVHIMGVRSQDANGAWSLDNCWIFVKPYTNLVAGPVPTITRIEYYIDTDPGLGLATGIPVTAATNILNLSAVLPLPPLNDSAHTLFVRSQDANGAWSLDNAYSFTYTGTLPVTLLSFTAVLTPQQDAALQWSTSAEENSSFYNIQRTSDGLHFNTIGTVPAADNSTLTNNYTYTDSTVAGLGITTVLYRLQEVDLDGKSTYSQIVSVNLAQSFRVSIWPNPIQQQQITLTIENSKPAAATIDVCNVSGRLLQRSQTSLQEGTNFIRLDCSSLPAGIYFLSVRTTGNHPVTLKFIKE